VILGYVTKTSTSFNAGLPMLGLVAAALGARWWYQPIPNGESH
jgi:hypothetical protein